MARRDLVLSPVFRVGVGTVLACMLQEWEWGRFLVAYKYRAWPKRRHGLNGWLRTSHVS
ncbi:hypothetical protein [Desulfosporosinus sp. OT]|uniref:hypothetical protein n=1 Tax=Desulfosporosinus sp. OT TaxID=913865 RepID=UPI001300C2D3|nr:hypothetical protein [Desulfosporosinus sp. OT]